MFQNKEVAELGFRTRTGRRDVCQHSLCGCKAFILVKLHELKPISTAASEHIAPAQPSETAIHTLSNNEEQKHFDKQNSYQGNRT